MIAGPKTSWGICGHESAVEQLQRSIVQNRVSHALLIAGPKGIGKTTFATAFAKSISCLNPPEPGVPCGECRACRKIDRGVHPDIQTFNLASQAITAEKSGGKNTGITIETVRDVSSTSALRPIEGRWRIVLLDDAETMNEVAQEALLKTLEEPPPSMLLVLLADDIEALLPTIRSRCQVIELRTVARSLIESALIERGAIPALAEELASLSDGAPGWAFRALDDPKLRDARLQAVDQAVTWIGAATYERLVQAVRAADDFSKSRWEPLERLGVLLSVWRDALLLGAGLRDRMTYLLFADRLSGLSAAWTLTDVHRAVQSVQQCIRDLETNVRPRLAMEAMVLQWPKPSRATQTPTSTKASIR